MLPDASSRKPLLSNKQFFPPFSLNKMREPNGKFMFLFWAPKLSWMFLPIFFFLSCFAHISINEAFEF